MSTPRPLAISCKASNCEEAIPKAKKRHAFSSPLHELPGVGGACIACGKQGLVDWERVHARDPADLEALIRFLRQELIRDNYWGKSLPEPIFRKAYKRSAEQLDLSIQRRLGASLRPDHPLERRQTPFAYSDSATIITCAQHGTGTCCRECLEKWHGHPRRATLREPDFNYLRQVIWGYVDRRLDPSRLRGT